MSWDSPIDCVYMWFILCHYCRIIQFLHIYIYLCILLLMTLGLFIIDPPTKTCCYAYSCMCTYGHYLLCKYPHVKLSAPEVCVSSTLQDATKQFSKAVLQVYTSTPPCMRIPVVMCPCHSHDLKLCWVDSLKLCRQWHPVLFCFKNRSIPSRKCSLCLTRLLKPL